MMVHTIIIETFFTQSGLSTFLAARCGRCGALRQAWSAAAGIQPAIPSLQEAEAAELSSAAPPGPGRCHCTAAVAAAAAAAACAAARGTRLRGHNIL